MPISSGTAAEGVWHCGDEMGIRAAGDEMGIEPNGASKQALARSGWHAVDDE